MAGTPGTTYARYVAANVRGLRTRLGLTQEEFVVKARINLHYLRRIERGTANPTVAMLAVLANALDVRAGVLLRRAHLVKRKPGRPRKMSARH